MSSGEYGKRGCRITIEQLSVYALVRDESQGGFFEMPAGRYTAFEIQSCALSGAFKVAREAAFGSAQ